MRGVKYFENISDRRKLRSGYKSTTEMTINGIRYYQVIFGPEYKHKKLNVVDTDEVLVNYRNRAAEACVEKMCLLTLALNVKIQQLPVGDPIEIKSLLTSLDNVPHNLFAYKIVERINGSPQICSTITGLSALLDLMTRRFTRAIYHGVPSDIKNKIVLFNTISDQIRTNGYNPFSFYGYFAIKQLEGEVIPTFEIIICASLTQQGFEERCTEEMIRSGLLPVRSNNTNMSTSLDKSSDSDKST